jgi:hypothetical protein
MSILNHPAQLGTLRQEIPGRDDVHDNHDRITARN